MKESKNFVYLVELRRTTVRTTSPDLIRLKTAIASACERPTNDSSLTDKISSPITKMIRNYYYYIVKHIYAHSQKLGHGLKEMTKDNNNKKGPELIELLS